MFKRCHVEVGRFAEKRIQKLPAHIRTALLVWAETVELQGVWEMRKLPGYHDEPLRGIRAGQRSSRLSRAYRVIYVEREGPEDVLILVLEVNKHEY